MIHLTVVIALHFIISRSLARVGLLLSLLSLSLFFQWVDLNFFILVSLSLSLHPPPFELPPMNVCFLVDNSVSMRQRGYNGLSLCEIAKNGVEFIMRQRLRQADSRGDSYYLIQSGTEQSSRSFSDSMMLLSTTEHDLSHFFFHLKNIKPQLNSDLFESLTCAYRTLSSFRFLVGADAVNGGRDVQKTDPSIVIAFTDASDCFSLERIAESLRKRHFAGASWDSTIIIFQLVLPSIVERTLLDPEIFSQQLRSSNLATKSLEDIANALGGSVIFVDSYEHLFQTIDL